MPTTSPRGLDLTVPAWVTGAAAALAFVVLVLLERRRPLRVTRREPKARRAVRNMAVASMGALAVHAVEMPIVLPAARAVQQQGWGLLKLAELPLWVEIPLALALMDYTLYIWHVLVHRVPWLWRFHAVHHVDLDLDASTALRFHFGELSLSVPWRMAQVLAIGVAPLSLSLWGAATLVSILFHHSNVELPIAWERRLSRVIVTPRLHGIHHSMMRDETNSNWSSGLTLWDWLHGTLRLNVPQNEITIGIPAYREPNEVRLPAVVAMPFTPQRPSWQLPGDGEPARLPAPPPATTLLR